MTDQTQSSSGLQIFMLVTFGAFAAGFILAASLFGKSYGSQTSLVDLLAAPGCLIPTVLLALLALGIALASGHYGKQWMDARVRVWQARASREEASTARRHAQANDLTPGPDGRELARLVQDQAGNVVLVQPGAATAPVTVVDAESGVRPNETPTPHVMAALLANAFAQMAQRGTRASGQAPDPMLYRALGLLGAPSVNDLVPMDVQIVGAEEVKRLEQG
jgi:hypothetical protein